METTASCKRKTAINSLAGISRETVLELAGQLNLETRETDLQPYDLYTADELFFTSTPYCIMPATRFNGLPVGDGRVGPTVKILLAAWSELVGVDIASQAMGQLSGDYRVATIVTGTSSRSHNAH